MMSIQRASAVVDLLPLPVSTLDLLRNELLDILSGGRRRRIFRRFNDALAVDREQLDRYYLYIEERNRERVKEWLESIGVKLILE